MQESGPRPHCFEPLQSVVVRVNLEWHRHEVWSELCNGPNNGEAFQLSGGVGFLCLVEGATRKADDTFFAFPDLSKNRVEACSRRVRIEKEREAEVRKGSDGTGGEERFEAVESVLALGAPVEDCVFPGQGIQWTGNGCEILNIPTVIAGKTQERANLCGIFGRVYFSDGGKKGGIG